VNTPRFAARAVTLFGLLLALFGIPLAVNGFRYFYGDVHSDLQFISKEALVFGVTAILLLVVLGGEKLPLSSIGLHTRSIWKSIGWGLLGVVISFAALASVILMAKFLLHMPFGGKDDNPYNPPMWLLLVTVLRAGLCEEICFRGYAIERLQSITGNKWFAGIFPLVLFALFHFRQGVLGIAAATMGGIVLTVLYMWRRDLLANIITHFVVDFIPNVLGPLFGG
jgi:uncharacterized protein